MDLKYGRARLPRSMLEGLGLCSVIKPESSWTECPTVTIFRYRTVLRSQALSTQLVQRSRSYVAQCSFWPMAVHWECFVNARIATKKNQNPSIIFPRAKGTPLNINHA